ncbi:hypothetical protein [Actinoplanes lobatus]|uniref:Uncharacterized protein n=1 Tax=Actinoplanes lobatus TaxID=113568 RepID=A0A7W7HNZ2_9ACTN|nr:hypothetical protein [Actinoplanes lobatus]MBB4754025.1 hypothetical protein [Actinoplanes lobatus]
MEYRTACLWSAVVADQVEAAVAEVVGDAPRRVHHLKDGVLVAGPECGEDRHVPGQA